MHQVLSILQCVIRRQRERIRDDAVLRTFDFVDFFRLLFDRHVLVDDADAALTGHRNRHPALRNRIHAGAHKGNIELDFLGEIRIQVYLIRNHLGIRGNEKYIVKCNAVLYNLSHLSSFIIKRQFSGRPRLRPHSL